MLRVENALTGREVSLTQREVEDAMFVRGPAEPLELSERAA